MLADFITQTVDSSEEDTDERIRSSLFAKKQPELYLNSSSAHKIYAKVEKKKLLSFFLNIKMEFT